VSTAASVRQGEPAVGRPRSSRRIVWAAAVLVAVPFAVAALSAIGAHWNPAGDQALEVMRIRDVATGHTPLLGPWSRFGWAHPGPALFWIMTPWYRALGNDGVLMGTAVLNLAAAVGVVLVASRIAPAAGVLAGAVTGVVAAALGLDFLLYPWNPWSAFFPFVLFLVFVWIVRAGRVAGLAGAVVVGSFVVQTHASYLAPVVGLLAFAALGVVLAACGRPALGGVAAGPARRHLLVAVVLGIVVWLPPLVEQFTADTGNLTRIARYLQQDEPTAGWENAFGTMGNHLRPLGPWITDDEQTRFGLERTTSTWWAWASIAAAAGLGVAAARRGARVAGQLAAVALLAVGLAVVATARVTSLLLPYVIGYWRPVVALTYLSIAWSSIEIIGTRRARTAGAVAGIGALSVVAILAVVHAPANPPLRPVSDAIGAVGPSTASALVRDHRYLVQGLDPATLNGGRTGLQLYLETRGYHVFHDHEPLGALMFGAHRLARTDAVDGRIIMAAVPALATGWQRPAGARIVASWDPLSPRARARADRLETAIRTAIRARPDELLGLDAPEQRRRAVLAGARRSDVEELGRLQHAGQAYRVFLVGS
jgi:hypothetical protein